jgi:hypothetical protein
MRIHNVEQGSGEWLKLHIGLPTASQFHRIVTPARGDFSKQSRDYAFYLVAEQLLNESFESISSLEWIARGKELEPRAVELYEFLEEVETVPIGFITTDDGKMGCSPDRVITGDRPLERALEIKCPAPQTHLKYWIDGFGPDYRPQVQGQLLIGEFETVDRYSFHPELPPVLARTERDEPYIDKLSAALREFIDMKDDMLGRLRATGYFEERQRLRTALDEQARAHLADYLGE